MTVAPDRTLPVIIVPCYNEQHRLDGERLRGLADSGRVRLLFVNDGSTDETAQMLAAMATGSPGIEAIDLAMNVGKAEAVRRGLLQAIGDGSDIVGYYDADLSTPPAELLRLVDLLGDSDGNDEGRVAVLGSRVARLGSVIERSATRHYLGRVFASAASAALGVRIYDTQCGAKVFRVTPALVAAVGEPFRSAWAFDVELLHRLFTGSAEVAPLSPETVVEVPLDAWRAVEGSRVRTKAAMSAFVAVATILCERKFRSWSSNGGDGITANRRASPHRRRRTPSGSGPAR